MLNNIKNFQKIKNKRTFQTQKKTQPNKNSKKIEKILQQIIYIDYK